MAAKATLEAQLARLTAEAAEIDAEYALGRATKADILRSERQLFAVIRALARRED